MKFLKQLFYRTQVDDSFFDAQLKIPLFFGKDIALYCLK